MALCIDPVNHNKFIANLPRNKTKFCFLCFHIIIYLRHYMSVRYYIVSNTDFRVRLSCHTTFVSRIGLSACFRQSCQVFNGIFFNTNNQYIIYIWTMKSFCAFLFYSKMINYNTHYTNFKSLYGHDSSNKFSYDNMSIFSKVTRI